MNKIKFSISFLAALAGAALAGAYCAGVDEQPLWWGWLIMTIGALIGAGIVRSSWPFKAKIIPPAVAVGIGTTMALICIQMNAINGEPVNVPLVGMFCGIAAVFGAIVVLIGSPQTPS